MILITHDIILITHDIIFPEHIAYLSSLKIFSFALQILSVIFRRKLSEENL